MPEWELRNRRGNSVFLGKCEFGDGLKEMLRWKIPPRLRRERTSTLPPIRPPVSIDMRGWMKLTRLLKLAGLGILVAFAGVVSAWLDWWEPRPVRDQRPFTFSDDFESGSTFADLVPKDGSRWHGRQLEPEQNGVELTTEVAHSGKQSLKCYAVPSRSDATSKADIQRGQLAFTEGDHVWSECWLLLKGGSSGEHVFLWDLETSRKWRSPGRRLYLQTGDVVASDLGKWAFAPTFRQPWDRGVPFPKDRWVRLRVHMLLAGGKNGTIQVWQDETKVLDANGQTLPTGKTVYDRLQVGVTANGSREHEHTLYVDDVIISNQPIP
jgi:hypothetical protein